MDISRNALTHFQKHFCKSAKRNLGDNSEGFYREIGIVSSGENPLIKTGRDFNGSLRTHGEIPGGVCGGNFNRIMRRIPCGIPGGNAGEISEVISIEISGRIS